MNNSGNHHADNAEKEFNKEWKCEVCECKETKIMFICNHCEEKHDDKKGCPVCRCTAHKEIEVCADCELAVE